ncbi:hypothetical protein KY285_000379 [Solanum tuberosum]|nr:hypothetical protein KY285_000379 [Solanum tuberosum]
MEVELICRKEFRDLTDKRSWTSCYFSGTSSRGRGSLRRGFHPQFSVHVHEAIQAFEGDYSGQGFYNSGQNLSGLLLQSYYHCGESGKSIEISTDLEREADINSVL